MSASKRLNSALVDTICARAIFAKYSGQVRTVSTALQALLLESLKAEIQRLRSIIVNLVSLEDFHVPFESAPGFFKARDPYLTSCGVPVVPKGPK
jgi:hypothetical protein